MCNYLRIALHITFHILYDIAHNFFYFMYKCIYMKDLLVRGIDPLQPLQELVLTYPHLYVVNI